MASLPISTRALNRPPPNITPEEAADWRTRHYGNEGFSERRQQFAASRIRVAIGDSWFDYLPARPLGDGDIIDCLNSTGRFNILPTAMAGDTVEDMARGTGFWVDGWKPRDTRQLKDAMFSGV